MKYNVFDVLGHLNAYAEYTAEHEDNPQLTEKCIAEVNRCREILYKQLVEAHILKYGVYYKEDDGHCAWYSVMYDRRTNQFWTRRDLAGWDEDVPRYIYDHKLDYDDFGELWDINPSRLDPGHYYNVVVGETWKW